MSRPEAPRDGGSAHSEHLRRLLDAGRADGPDPAQAARLAARLAPLFEPTGSASGAPDGAGGAPGLAGGASPAAGSSLWGLPATKLGGALVMLMVGGAAGLALLGPGVRAPAHEAPPATTALASARTLAEAAPPAPEPVLVLAPAQSTLPVSTSLPGAVSGRTAAEPPPRRAARGTVTPVPAAQRHAPPRTGATEIELLDRAQRALAAAPDEALSLADEHAARFAAGSLAPERETIAIGALVALGRRDEAQRRADRFRADHPGSAYLRRIDVLLAR